MLLVRSAAAAGGAGVVQAPGWSPGDGAASTIPDPPADVGLRTVSEHAPVEFSARGYDKLNEPVEAKLSICWGSGNAFWEEFGGFCA